MTAQSHNRFVFCVVVVEFAVNGNQDFVVVVEFRIKPSFHKANFDNENDQFRVKETQLVGGMTAQPHNRFVSCVVVLEFAVNGNQALWKPGFRTHGCKHCQTHGFTV